MHDEHDVRPKRKGSWLAGIVLSVVHLLAFGMLYLVILQINWSFQDYYKLVGIKLTPEFERIVLISHFIAGYMPIALLVIAMDIFIVFRLARKGSRWTSAYSHAVLLCIGFTGFFWTARSVEPMARSVPGIEKPALVNVNTTGNDLESTIDLQPSGEP